MANTVHEVVIVDSNDANTTDLPYSEVHNKTVTNHNCDAETHFASNVSPEGTHGSNFHKLFIDTGANTAGPRTLDDEARREVLKNETTCCHHVVINKPVVGVRNEEETSKT